MPLSRHRNPISRLWARMLILADQRRGSRALHWLNATSDKALSARGLTRADEIGRSPGSLCRA